MNTDTNTEKEELSAEEKEKEEKEEAFSIAVWKNHVLHPGRIHDAVWTWMKYTMFHSSWNNEYCHIYPSYNADEIPNKGSLARLVKKDDYEIIVVEDRSSLFFKIVPRILTAYPVNYLVDALTQLKTDAEAKRVFGSSTFKEKIRLFDGFLTCLPVNEVDMKVCFYTNEQDDEVADERGEEDTVRIYIKKYTWVI